MTIYELTNQLIKISVDGKFNGEKRSEKWLRTYILSMFRAGDNDLIMEISLTDGDWLFSIHKWEEHYHDCYDYTIPETREQEDRSYEKLGVKRDDVDKKI